MIATALAVLAPLLPAQESEVRDLASVLAPILKEHELPALAGAVVHGGRVVALGAVGVRAAGRDDPVGPGDRFHIGSCTKAMTATLAGVLVERGELAWDRTLAETFPELADEMDEDWRAVTLVDLLAHRSGARRDPPDPGKLEGTPSEQRLAVLRALVTEPAEHMPGPEHQYSNAGYILAGAMLERAGGAPWEELMRRHLFEPLGMTSAGFGAPDAEHPHQPLGHYPNGEPIPGWDNPPVYGPAGTVHCSLTDWGRFIAAHLAAGEGEGALLRPETFERLHTPPAGSYALGWGVGTRGWAGLADSDGTEGEGPVLSHAGSNTRWTCEVWLAPERDFAVLAATNRAGEPGRLGCAAATGALIRFHLER